MRIVVELMPFSLINLLKNFVTLEKVNLCLLYECESVGKKYSFDNIWCKIFITNMKTKKID